MPLAFTAQELQDFPELISGPRFNTFLTHANGDYHKALEFYIWNVQLSAAFMVPLQLCEVAVRNGVVEAIEKVHGASWRSAVGFVRSLPHLNRPGYQPQNDLREQAAKQPSAGKVVAELKFAFWQHMFTKGQDARLWLPHFVNCFPGYNAALTVKQARASMHHELGLVRSFRNRIAHHEPIFTRNLVAEYERVRQLVEWRRPSVAAWMDANQTISALLSSPP